MSDLRDGGGWRDSCRRHPAESPHRRRAAPAQAHRLPPLKLLAAHAPKWLGAPSGVIPSGEAGNETPEASAQGVQTDGGTWVAPRYTALTVEWDGYVSKGCDIRLEFQPNQWVDADCIALVQTCRGLVSEAEGQEFEPNFIGDPARERRAAGGDGWHIDSGGGDVSPVYGVDAREEGTPLTDFGDASFTNHGFGRSTFGDAGRAQRAPAFLTDRPSRVGSREGPTRLSLRPRHSAPRGPTRARGTAPSAGAARSRGPAPSPYMHSRWLIPAAPVPLSAVPPRVGTKTRQR